jgi:phosphatidylglycerol lysyltransferase
LVPLPLAEASHLVGSIAGVALLIVARGLLRRFHTAWLVTLGLLAAGAGAALLKGLNVETAAVLAAVAAVLFVFRDSFHRRRDVSELRLSPAWLAMVLAAAVAAGWLGLFAYRHVDYAHELWWQFAWAGDAPRFLRASVAVSAVVVCAAVWMLVHQPLATPFRPDPVTDTVRRLVANSKQTQHNVALLGDKKFLFAPDESAFLMYGRAGRSFVAMGEPVGHSAMAAELIWRFHELADKEGGRAVYYAVSPAHLSTFLDMGLSILKIGEVARVDLAAFSLEGKKGQDFRYADRRAAKEGIVFDVLPKEEVPRYLSELRAISDAWLSLKSGHEKGFSLGSFSSAYLAEFDCAVLRDANGAIAFANIWRSSGHEEISVDLMRYRPHESKVLMDALFARLLLYGKAEGYRWFNLGAAPLAGLEQHRLASNWNWFGNLLYRHGEHFYHFEGLRAFKQKFEPVWTSQYIAGPGGLALPGVLYDITTLISGGRFGVLAK